MTLKNINSKQEFTSILKKNSQNSLSGGSNKNDLIVLDFFDDCTHCSEMNHKLEEISSNYELGSNQRGGMRRGAGDSSSSSNVEDQPSVQFFKVNIEDDKQLANEFSISSIPTTLFFKKGKLIDKVVGPEPNEIKRIIDDNEMM
ncbi:uncharacterized protein KGF55_005716 [Candida pseudojiufengensis]|uniref:uncharacterized protein n=1 Tax=Candida pseudojiufengensis TaxID=497109 RepID=UPI00222404A8|nr:uncharacterized protein KGF55_005716 [Candida pseudojiufengensis]KAI5958718.1 hypothetical protein KGF55_005716 [Candida pseudojiufengensis]